MAVEYRTTIKGKVNDGFSQGLNESYQYFKNRHHVSILGEGIKDILGDNELFAEYMDNLTEGLDPTESENVKMLMSNARMQTFAESSVAGIAPVASLTFPSIRKLWARTHSIIP
jgi:hypothetical protein